MQLYKIMEPQLGYWIEKGGAFAVIAILFYFYRRDWATLTQYWQQQNSLLMDIVRTNTVELGKMQESLKMYHVETISSFEAIRTRLHEISQPMSAITAGVGLLLKKNNKED